MLGNTVSRKQKSLTTWCKKFQERLKSCTWFLFDSEGFKYFAVIIAECQLSSSDLVSKASFHKWI